MNDIIASFEVLKNFDYLWFLMNFLTSLTLEDFIKILVIYLLILWASIIVWVTKDIINRTNNILFQIFSILTVVILTPLWIILYFIIRPAKTLFEKGYTDPDFEEYEEEIYSDTLLAEIEKIVNWKWFDSKCRSCDFDVKSDYKYCPNCRIELKKNCISCKKEIKDNWDYCPHCWSDQDQKVAKILNTMNFLWNKKSTKKIEEKIYWEVEDNKDEKPTEIKKEETKKEV